MIALLCLAALAALELPALGPPPAIVGALRWDGWWAGNPWERNLDPREWRSRLPFYARETAEGRVEVRSDRQEVMDREIAYALRGGLAFWAFCYYHPSSWPEADRYNYGWRQFLASRRRGALRYCFILQGGSHMGPRERWAETARELAGHFRRREYQRAPAGRPLLFVFATQYLEPHFGGAQEVRAAFDLLRAESRRAGAGNPYVVAQVFRAEDGVRAVERWGFDAIGAYSAHAHDEHREHTYADLVGANRWYRTSFAATGKPMVPTVNAGWDGRPRLRDPEWARHYRGAWYAQPTPEELAANVREAVAWVRAHPAQAEAGAVLIYAWNETDEGGWLVPTHAEGPARLDALRRALDAAR
ncbi:MAG TPA: glycoside hydrolase family 99-like domain-containing protein [Chthonomonadales bacterium]|nr:glycoside hydrolase family 99-like domain-containing protein [Chthonomonadales bacterium]